MKIKDSITIKIEITVERKQGAATPPSQLLVKCQEASFFLDLERVLVGAWAPRQVGTKEGSAPP